MKSYSIHYHQVVSPNIDPTPKRSVRAKGIWPKLLAPGLAIALVLILATIANAAAPTGFMQYYIPGGEEQLWNIFVDMDNYDQTTGDGELDETAGMHAVVSVVAAADKTTVYYDHWEDGYDFDPNDPASTADETVVLDRGEVHVFESWNIPINPRGTGLNVCRSYAGDPTANDPCYDGTDRIYTAGGIVTVNRASWTESAGASTLYAFAWEVYPTKPYMTHYTIPVGENLTGMLQYEDFQNVYVMVQATQDGTAIEIDDPKTGGVDVSTVVGQGGTTELYHIDAGTTVSATAPVQVQFIVGTDGVRGHYECRGFTAVPSGLWSDEYYVPVGTTADHLLSRSGWGAFADSQYTYDYRASRVIDGNSNTHWRSAYTALPHYVGVDMYGFWKLSGFRYLPRQDSSNGRILNYEFQVSLNGTSWTTVATGTFASDASQKEVFFPPTAARYARLRALTVSGGVQYATTAELSLLRRHVSDVYIYNPSATDVLTVTWEDSSGSGTFTVPASGTKSYSDGTGHPVPQGSAAFLSGSHTFWGIGSVDAEASAYDWGYSLIPKYLLPDDYTIGWAPSTLDTSAQGSPLFVTPLEDNTTVYVDYDVDGTVDAQYSVDRLEELKLYDPDFDMTGAHVWATHPVAIVWGEDGDVAGGGYNYLDMGYTTLPAPEGWVDLVLTAEKSVSPIVLQAGSVQTTTFTIVASTYDYPVNGFSITDTLPVSWTYASGTTHIITTSGGTLAPPASEPTVSGQDLFWGPSQLGGLGANQVVTVTFDAYTTDEFASGDISCNAIQAVVTRTVGAETQTFTAWDQACNLFTALQMEKTSAVSDDPLGPSDTITYTIVVNNPASSGGPQTEVTVDDSLPAGLTYVSESTQVAKRYHETVRDEFGEQSYDNNDGTQDWAGNWTETGDTNLGPQSQYIYISSTDERLVFYYIWTERIERNANLSSCTTGATLSFDYDMTSLNGAYSLAARASANGNSSYNTVGTCSGGTSGSASIDISGYTSPNTYIQFVNGGANWASGNYGYIDNVQIDCRGGLETRTNGTGDPDPLTDGDPPNLVVLADGYSLLPGDAMTITWKARVTDPIPLGLTSIVNTACVDSDQLPSPFCDSATDEIEQGAIGNYVWLDEDGDGDQDAGEAGIPNTVVELYNSAGALVLTTTADADGGYLFGSLPPGAYTVTVRSASLPGSLAANQTGDPDGTFDHSTLVALDGGEEYLDADFGYNWSSATETNAPPSDGTGAIGDRIWIDADGDGAQDPGEPGLEGIEAALYSDPDGNGVYDTQVATTTTDAAGNYIFDGLPAGGYVVVVNGGSAPSGYTQTGDPDEFGQAATSPDHQTSTPIVLAPGDVYVNADFGYQPSTSSAIGDTIYFDADGNGALGGSDYGIPGVTVALLDSDGDVIATTVTTETGGYLFTGLPAGAYVVWVTDTDNVLGELDQTGDPDGGLDGKSTTTVNGSTDDLTQDHGYAPPDHGSGDGLIGDFIFLDANGDDSYDAGEPGLEGVTVTLTDSSGDTTTTVTDENGHYSFGSLPAGVYTVTVSAPAGLVNSVDPDGGTASQSVVTIGAGGVNLAQDYGYKASAPNAISGTIWEDTDADGALGGGEVNRFAGVTVVLLDQDDNIVAITTTNGSGDYSFTGLPDGTYRVDVTDDGNVLNGYWHSQGSSPGSDDNSQADPYTVTVTGNQTNTTADFGYYVQPADIGNFVWLDVDDDGVQDLSDEPGIRGVTVVLTITYPNGVVITMTTITGDNGAYGFGNLLLDEDYNTGDSAGGTPTYEVGAPAPPSLSLAQESAPGNDDQTDGDSDGASEIATMVQGESDPSYDFGFTGNLDLGDLPDESIPGPPDYPTKYRPGPAHVVFPDEDANPGPDTKGGIPAVWLGLAVDVEPDGQPSANATGDGADEDGLVFAPKGWSAGSTAIITATLNSSESGITVYFGLWIDWDKDGTFEDFYAGSGVTGSPVGVPVSASVPVGYVSNNPVYFRVRASDAPLSASDYQGTLLNGEVEDYEKEFGPTAVTLVSFSAHSGERVPIAWVWAVVAIACAACWALLLRRRRWCEQR